MTDTYDLRRIIGRRFGIRPHLVRRADIKILMGYFDMADLSNLSEEDRAVFLAEGKKRGLFTPSRQ